VFAQTWVNPSNFAVPLFGCCTTNSASLAAAILPGTTWSGTTTGGRLLIEATIPLSASAGPTLWCQPNIDGVWAGQPMGSASFDYVYQATSTTARFNATISRVYPAPPAGTHTFSLGCATHAGTFSLIAGGVISYTVLELH
jgi:hypothetical protein